jgi:hypothetical protein
MFVKSSRYYNLPNRTWSGPDGREVVYKCVRLIPRPSHAFKTKTVVGQSERLDLVASRTQGRSELYWRLCDANRALDPFILVESQGHQLWLPEG